MCTTDCITYSTFVTGTTTEDRTCELCEAGKFRADTGHRLTECEACADDTFQSDEGQSSCMACNECEPGYVIDQDCTPTSDRTCKDIAKPTIVLRRPDNNEEIQDTYVVEATFAFDPPIFTATDTAAGTVTKTPPPNIDDIDTSTVGSDQMLTYTATDANMNTATRDITVEVVDTTGPAITFDPAVLQLEAGEEVMRSNFTAGVSIVDRVDGTLGIDLLEYDASDVDVNTLGMYEVVYTLSASDSNDNEAPPTTRTAAVVDTLPPVITIGFGDREVLEHNVVIHEAATEFIFPSQSAFDTFDTAVNGGDVRRNEESTFDSVVDDGTQFTFTYTATDASDNTATVVYVIEVRDTMAPSITINGEHNITHEAGTEYVDAGATATDLLEDAIGRGVEVVVTNNVLSKPPSVPAVFTVEYDACDKAGNCDAINRTVHVLDRTAPSIELIGDALLVVEAGSNFTDIDPGVTLADLYYDNADLTLVIDDGGYEAAPTTSPATFTVTYTVTDPSRNTASVTRTITIIDTTPPDLRVSGDLSVTVGDGVTWVEPGIARAYDNIDGDVRSRVVATTQLEEAGVVVPTVCAYSSARAFMPPLSPRVWSSPRMDAVESRAPSGTVYRINYTVADAASNVAFVERVVRVADPTAPSLQLLGDRVQALEFGDDRGSFADPGATALDAHDGDLSGDVCVGVSVVTRDASGVVAPGDVDGIGEDAIARQGNDEAFDVLGLDAAVASAEVGTVYVLQYSVHDRAGNAAVGVQRAVVVVDTTPPDVTLYGAEEVHVLYATRYVEAGYSAQDVHDGNVTSQVVVSGADAIDVHVAGTYEVEYAVTDANGNTGVAVRTVVVEALMRPERADQVVELVLAGTAESIFGGDVQQLERDLEEALNVDFVVVFLVYDKALGRPTTDINTVPQQQQGRRRRSSSGSSRDSDNNNNNYSDSDNAWIRGRRGLLAQPSTVVEFGVRNGTSLEWVPADILLARLEGLETLAAAHITSVADAKKRGGGSDGGAVAGAVVGVLLVLGCVASIVWRRRKRAQAELATVKNIINATNPTFSPHSEDATGEPAQVQHKWNPSLYDIAPPRQQHHQQQHEQQSAVDAQSMDHHSDPTHVYATPSLLPELQPNTPHHSRVHSMHAWSAGLYDIEEEGWEEEHEDRGTELQAEAKAGRSGVALGENAGAQHESLFGQRLRVVSEQQQQRKQSQPTYDVVEAVTRTFTKCESEA
ncbi:hypothetical protein PTSG_12379 [Salpingoeca rosetta]|uniref:HYR domain-containing protein n=1 Tax=Salpingoeca rosetta (strain ATCC 50818 / BSB-021) TaxID=946362 RepID=F2UDE2_SALR5|nr:uncharacterized protein PTSG_12379 [Salpingoeca rosetta]EGD74637.1 hypothetical protein PTSG_12379 [Salpingoeca rosetta]|eukprot:XP_004992894.1 hypothetical protein PTSG_12379 [Salpingoeca rosetta]